MDVPLLPAIAVDHVGIAAHDPGSPLAAMLASALDAGAPTRLAAESRTMKSGVIVARFGPGRGLELVWPGRSETPIDAFLTRRGAGLHHVALRVDESLTDLRGRLLAAGVEVIGKIDVSSDGRPCVFLHPRSTGGVLVELVQGRGPN